jgi:hypothetical protein
MLPLDSPHWSELRHAYGAADDIPALLRQLESFPDSKKYTDAPWYSLWSALCHQDDVYSASFAAVPHIVRVLASDPLRAQFCFFQLPAQIEICRRRKDVLIPPDLRESYHAALAQLPGLVGAAAAREWDSDFLCCALSAIAASKGFPEVGAAAQELTPEVATKFMEWFYAQ